MLDFEEQAIIKMYEFSSKEELITKLKEAKQYISDKSMLQKVNILLEKLKSINYKELLECKNIYE